MRWFVHSAGLGLAAAALVTGCGSKTVAPPKPRQLHLLAEHSLNLREPSGLAINDSGTVLWVVTNDPDKIYQLDSSGNRVKTLDYVGEDLEGIAYDRTDGSLWIVEENRREVIHLDLNGAILSRHPLGLTGEQNSGLEGICLDDQHRMFVLNEKHPGLFIELNTNLAVTVQTFLYFAQDYSDICYNRQKGCFWMLSDQSQRLYLWSTHDGAMAEYSLPYPKAEGIAFDEARGLIYIVSDSERKLYVYSETAP